MPWVATDRAEVVKLAEPTPLRGILPRVLAPSVKVTVPVGVPEKGAFTATLAVKVMAWPKVDGLGAAESVVVVPVCACVAKGSNKNKKRRRRDAKRQRFPEVDIEHLSSLFSYSIYLVPKELEIPYGLVP
jgi:hypothetical protein